MAERLWQHVPEKIQYIGTKAVESMLLEANSAPAPGLVDRFNSGAHKDMDIYTFIYSSVALAPYMYEFAYCGYTYEGPVTSLLETIRPIGIEAEKNMFQATEGVNTQKGLIFLMGILCSAAGYTVQCGERLTAAAVLQHVQDMCCGLVQRELKEMSAKKILTAGERLYRQYGVTGIRGEVEAGIPVIKEHALPAYDRAVQAGLRKDALLIYVLIHIMAYTEDTTILNRHDMETLKAVQEEALEIVQDKNIQDFNDLSFVHELDVKYIGKNISPGGSADILAATHLLYSLEHGLL